MIAEEFYDKINHIIDDARTPDQAREWSDKFFKELQEQTRIKCLEAIRNTRNKACEIIIEYASKGHPLTLTSISRDIMNIPSQNVMPKL